MNKLPVLARQMVYPLIFCADRFCAQAIMLVESVDGKHALLGRPRSLKRRGPVLTCLSGFIEQGESIEEAVRPSQASMELANALSSSCGAWSCTVSQWAWDSCVSHSVMPAFFAFSRKV